VTIIAVTGHMDLTEDSIPLVRTALDDLLKQYASDLVGVTCIANSSPVVAPATAWRTAVRSSSRAARSRPCRSALWCSALVGRLGAVPSPGVTRCRS
jgi:hypothetical protein